MRAIVRAVRDGGDKALFSYCKQFDGTDLTPDTLFVSEEEISAAYAAVDDDLLSSMEKAARNILDYHSRNPLLQDVRTAGGRTTGYVWRAVGRAGIYVPGGTAPLFSSVMMGVLPAQAAGVEHIFVATPAKEGKVHPAVIVAADMCGAEKIIKAGGAQVIAALAYGTESIPAVDVIAGPGNISVTLAKKEVYGRVGIDILAGPNVAEPCPVPVQVTAPPCADSVHADLGDVTVPGMGRMLTVSLTLKNVCPAREVAVGILVTEVLDGGGEAVRGYKSLTVPAQGGDAP